ncbi:AsmA-like C-terminal region-containing protein [Hymenobacter tibetensis]|uniref:AsmA-like C-terminal region-containing protein n=1 Tax=Hymenobacter tibetensis TaxID=497967 RepID=A0ABY4D9G3_9BACT|nr:AsmA-like C-terminal region-containing protein [Hymenobacter tibetensis]UOG76718.1 AsmA-like C-terminal region-containing protein [Hymenobacter tibetensis]
MKRPTFRQLLGFSLLGMVVVVLGVAGLLGSNWGRRQVEALVRERMARNSDLVLAPFEVEFSALRDFPDFTVSVHHFHLTDTTARGAVPVLRIGRAEARLALSKLLRGNVHVHHLTLFDTEFRQFTDSQGTDWGLHGKGARRQRATIPPDFDLDSLLLVNFRVADRNDLQKSGFEAFVRRAHLHVKGREGVAQVRGALHGELVYLRSGRGNLFEREPVRAWVGYQYNFEERKGTFLRTLATLNGDTVLIRGTHQAPPPGQPRGTRLDLRMVGSQPLLEVLRVALPSGLHRFLAGAKSPSHARIWYTIKGFSGPTTRPRTILQFQLQNAQLRWADSLRRIRRWDARGIFDNGSDHSSRTTSLTFSQCRLYSSAGELDAALTVRDFTRPFLGGRVRGRTELQTLSAVVAPGLWQARNGNAALDLHLNGPLQELTTLPGNRVARTAASALPPLRVRGTITLEDASFRVPSRDATVSGLNVRLGLRDSSWLLENLSGRLNGMNVRANATTTYLLSYFNGQHPVTTVTGRFTVDELRLDQLRRLLAPPTGRATRLPREKRRSRPQRQELAARAMNLLPPGLHLNIKLWCGRLVLRADTLHDLAATVRHNGRQVQLTQLQTRVWGGSVKGAVSWPTDTLQTQPVSVQLSLRFNTMQYRRVLALLDRSPQRPSSPTSFTADPSLREVLLSANGQVVASIGTLRLPAGENLTNLHLRINKTGTAFRIPYLNFSTSAGGAGRVSANARLDAGQLAAAHADVNLRYGTLDVQRLLRLLAALTPPAPQNQLASAARLRSSSPFLDGTVTARIRVSADRVQYAVLRGNDFRLISRLEPGAARLESCTLRAFGGSISLQGRMQTDAGAAHHPLRAQVRLQEVELPALFRLAEALRFDVLRPDNIRGTMRCEADLHTDLNEAFLPDLDNTYAYLKTDLRNLELLDVEALTEALKFLRAKRTSHLYFEPVSPRFVLDGARVLVPDLHLNSNLSDLQVSGEYYLNGQTDMFVGLSPMQALFGNNKKRVARIQSGEATSQPSRGLLYVRLNRLPGTPYKVRPFQKLEQRRQQELLQHEYQRFLRTHQIDTTLRLLR